MERRIFRKPFATVPDAVKAELERWGIDCDSIEKTDFDEFAEWNGVEVREQGKGARLIRLFTDEWGRVDEDATNVFHISWVLLLGLLDAHKEKSSALPEWINRIELNAEKRDYFGKCV